jgi:rhodanese-related sulfurtransferase
MVAAALVVSLAAGFGPPAPEHADVAPQAAERAVGLSEDSLRRMAVTAPMPEYPRASLQDKSAGVAVAAVAFGADGQTRTVTVLEAPDPHIADAVKEAVMRWTWKPVTVMGRAESFGGHATLTFYFRIAGGQGQVVNPDLPPAPKPAPSAGAPPATPAVQHGGHHGGPVTEITDAELKKLTGAAAPVILDIGERDAFRRGHRDGAINIPANELTVRARMELDPKKRHVIDCTRDERPRCNMALEILKRKGFSQLSVLVR